MRKKGAVVPVSHTAVCACLQALFLAVARGNTWSVLAAGSVEKLV